MKQYLIADSGGTRTDWCFVDTNGERQHFSTESYHPVNWDNAFIQRITEYWKSHSEMLNAELHFFGSGCFKASKADEMSALLKRVGFQKVVVKSDLHGAALACLGNSHGWVAILGTGSVLFEWNGQDVTKIIGGKGHVLGDEGSGFYFGKLVYEAWCNQTLSEEQTKYISEKVDFRILEEKCSTGDEKFALATLSEVLGSNEITAGFHRENIRVFCVSHFKQEVPEKLHFVGSYAHHNRSHLQQILGDYKVQIGSIIAKPIEQIVERTAVHID